MTKIYISSTFKDLERHRDAVARILRRMRKIVVSMEDYTASDERPVDKCLADVADCDVYVGLFAHRYGFVPPHENPLGLSITELELAQARELGKPCLIFLHDETVPWPLTEADSYTGENDRGTRIKALRERLGVEFNRNLFRSPEDLAGSVSSSVANLIEREQPGRSAAAPQQKAAAAAPLPREITADLLLAYSEVDAVYVNDLMTYLRSQKLRVQLSPNALLAGTSEDVERLERGLRQCHAAAVVVSDASLRQLQERRQFTSNLLEMLEARTGQAFALCLGNDAAAAMADWPAVAIERASDWKPREMSPPDNLHGRLEALRLGTGVDSGRSWVGLPVIVVAMTDAEAAELDGDPEVVREKLGRSAHQRFMELRAAIGGGAGMSGKYRARRHEFRPFIGADASVRSVLGTIVDRVNDEQPAQLRGRMIKLQSYRFDDLVRSADLFGPIFTQLASTGCVVIVDEYSLFHPNIQESLASSGLFANEQVSLVTLSPSNPYSSAPFDLLEAELRRRLAAAFHRFASSFDPQCELSVGDEQRLKRWLNLSLPHAIQSLRHPRPNRQNILQFAHEQGLDLQPTIGALLYTEGGPL